MGRSRGSGTYGFALRPARAGHGHPVLVFDSQNRLHLPLTTFAREATRQLSPGSLKVYLYAVLPFFAFLDASRPPDDKSGSWNAEPERIRRDVAEYLEDDLGCVVRRHRHGFELVTVTGRSRANAGGFLAALKLFYSVMREIGCYAAENPLLDASWRWLDEIADEGDDTDDGRPAQDA